VLKTIDDEIIMKAAKFRQNGRFPVLSYYHKENGVSRLLSVVYIKHVLGSFSFQVNINFCFMYTVVQKTPVLFI